jgi:hypothetical protein
MRDWKSLCGAPSYILGNSQTSGIFTYHSGLPFTVAVTSNNPFVGQQAAAYPDRICNGALPASQRAVDEWFNPARFVVPTPFAPGNEGSNILTGPSPTTLDFGLLRRSPLAKSGGWNFAGRPSTYLTRPSSACPRATLRVQVPSAVSLPWPEIHV